MSKFDNAFNYSKSGFEEIFSKTRDVAVSINKKGTQALDLSRKRFEFLDTKAKLSKAYEKYGRLQFSINVNEPVNSQELEDVTALIMSYRDKLEALKEEIEDSSEIKDTSEIKREAQELKKEVKAASIEAREVFKKQMEEVRKNAKEVFKNVQPQSKDNDQPEITEVEPQVQKQTEE